VQAKNDARLVRQRQMHFSGCRKRKKRDFMTRNINQSPLMLRGFARGSSFIL